MIYHFILNPKSGRGRKYKNLESAIKTACKKRAVSYHIYYTTCPGDATEYVASMVRISQDRQRFICIGGDGTINEVVNSAPCNENVEFGVIPNGSGNDFIRNFTNKKNFADIEAQLDGETLTFDLIKCNDTYCVNMVNIGLDCAVARLAGKLKKSIFVPAKLSYVFGLFIIMFRKIGTKMKISFDDGSVIDKVMTLTAIGNGRYCGGGFCATPSAILDDGLANICAIDKISIFKFISLVGAYKKGKHLTNKRAQKVIHHRTESHFKMEFEEPVAVCLDGEIKGAIKIDFLVVKNGFKFVVPKGSTYKNTLPN
ncbi:MAG: diacylglycerol kinase family lipid kinase [Clostridia bacterium]|nr:diacylglycerol kinase family lipid kinase [Clostridia bacterium]